MSANGYPHLATRNAWSICGVPDSVCWWKQATPGVAVPGRLPLLTDRATVRQICGRISAKCQRGADPGGPDALDILYGGSAPRNTVVVAGPTRVGSWDHRRVGGAL